MSIYATGSIELKSPGGSGTLVITASDSGVVATRPVYVSGSGENNYGKIHNTTGSLSFSTRRKGAGEFTDSVIFRDGNVGIGVEPGSTYNLQIQGGQVMVGDGALGAAAKISFGNANTYFERPTGSSTFRMQTDRPVIFDTGGSYSLYANSFTFKNANESKKIWSVSQTQDLADSTEQTKVWIHEDNADAVILLKDPTAAAHEISNGTEVLKFRGTQGTGSERMSTIVSGSGNLHVRNDAHVTGSIYIKNASIIKAGQSTISFDSTKTIISGELQINGNEIKASDGGGVITWDTDDNVQIGNLGSTTGTLQINGNEIKKNGGTTMIDFPAVVGDPTRLSGDLQINGGDIKDSTSAVAITLQTAPSSRVVLGKDLVLPANGHIRDSSDTVILGVDGSNQINELADIDTTLVVLDDVSIKGDGGTVTVAIGDQQEQDLRLYFKGHQKFGYIGLDDSLDKLCIGEAATPGASAHISMNLDSIDTNKRTEVTGSVEITRGLTTGVDGGGNTLNGITAINGATTINSDLVYIKTDGNNEDAQIHVWADRGDNDIDKWKLQAGASNPWFSIQTLADGVSYKSFIDLKTDATEENRSMCVTGSIGLTTGKIRVDSNNLELLAAADSSKSDAEARSVGARIMMNSDGEVGIGTSPASGYVLATKSVGGSNDDRKCLIGGDLYVDGDLQVSGGDIADAGGTIAIQLSGPDVTIVDDLTVGDALIVGADIRINGNDIRDSGNNIVLSFDGAGNIDTCPTVFKGNTAHKLTLWENDNSDPGVGPEMRFYRTDDSGVTGGTNLGEIWWYGSEDDSTFKAGAAIIGEGDGAWDPGTNDCPGRLTFYTSPDGAAAVSERLRITSEGNVGIGSTSSGDINLFRLLVVHTDDDGHIIKFHNKSSDSNADVLVLEVEATTPGTTNNYITFLKGNGNTIGEIEGDGSGGTRFTGNAAGTYSDMRLKTDLRSIEGAIDTVKSLEIYDYEMIGDDTGTRRQGFSAQQLLDISPQSVYTPYNKDKSTGKEYIEGDPNYRYMRVNAGTLAPLLAAALQEACTKIDDLTSRIEALEKS